MATSLVRESQALFIRRWGEMGASWGISRTMAEIHALLFLSTEPLCTDDIMDRLQVSRGNVSMNLRQLQNWGLIHREHRRGDRREYFVAETDVWQMFEIITRERRRREIEPIIETIEKCRQMVEQHLAAHGGEGGDGIKEYQRRLNHMQKFFTAMNTLFNIVVKVGQRGIGPVTKALSKWSG